MNLLESIYRDKFGASQQKIAEWYRDAKPLTDGVYYDLAVGAWKRLADESTKLAGIVRKIVHVRESWLPEPYSNAQFMFWDIGEYNRFSVSTANSDHPLWTITQNVSFRIVHDVLGHWPVRAAFDWAGEVQACIEHASHHSELAQRALFSECLGQSAFCTVYGYFGPQKIVLP